MFKEEKNVVIDKYICFGKEFLYRFGYQTNECYSLVRTNIYLAGGFKFDTLEDYKTKAKHNK